MVFVIAIIIENLGGNAKRTFGNLYLWQLGIYLLDPFNNDHLKFLVWFVHTSLVLCGHD